MRHTSTDCPCGGHGFVFAGYQNCADAAKRPDWCSRPQIMVNVHTRESYLARCKSARESRCPYCSDLHKKAIAAIARSGWTDDVSGRGFWCALTAPGEDVLPFDRSLCTHPRSVRCSGKDHGCQVEAIPLARWHDTLGLRWSHFVHDVRRMLNPGCTGAVSSWPVKVEFLKTYEPQARGALHAHFMLRVEGVCSVKRFERVYRKAARRHGFGKEMHCKPVQLTGDEGTELEAAKKAGYAAKYATKCADHLPSVRRLNSSTGEFSSGGFRSWSASRGWGITMKSINLSRRHWAAANGAVTGGAGTDTVDGALDLNQDLYASALGLAPVCPVSSSDLLV